MKKVLITICGRAGSKGFKNKNLKVFCEQPLVYYTLSSAEMFIESRKDLQVDICLNTDSDLLVDLVKEKYPEVVYIKRTEELCGDVIAKMAVFQHSLAEMEKLNNVTYDYLIDLDITSPMRQDGDILKAFTIKENRSDLDLVFTVADSRRNPYMNMAQAVGDLEVDGHVERVIDVVYTARQQTPKTYDINASIYVFERKFLVENTTSFLWDGKCSISKMFDTGILDIDSEEDYLLLEAIAQHLYNTKNEFSVVKNNIRK